MDLTLRNIRGETITFDDPIRVGKVVGLGLPPLAHSSERYAQQDGATLRQVALLPRTLIVPYKLLTADYATLWSEQADLYRFLSAVKSPYTWIATLPDGTVRHLDCYIESELSMPYDPDLGPRVAEDVGIWTAYDPTWYDPVSTLWAYGVSGGSGSWIFPLAFPGGFGSQFVDVVETRQYPGTWRAYPIITITGPLEDFIVENETLDLKLDFTGYTLDAARTLTIDCRPGYKTVTHSIDGNLPGALTDDSDLGQFRIGEHPYAVDGSNTMRIYGTGANVNTRIEIRFNARYLALAS